MEVGKVKGRCSPVQSSSGPKTPILRHIASAVSLLSPVMTITLIPAEQHSSIDCLTSARGGSNIPTTPTNVMSLCRRGTRPHPLTRLEREEDLYLVLDKVLGIFEVHLFRTTWFLHCGQRQTTQSVLSCRTHQRNTWSVVVKVTVTCAISPDDR